MTGAARARARGAGMVVAIALAMPLSACQHAFGPTPAGFDPAQEPAGIRAELRVGSGIVRGEVLEVREDELLLLADSPTRVVRVPLEAVRVGRFEQVREQIVRGDFISDDQRERIRQMSRFPTGVTQDVLGALLQAYGQREPEVVQ